MEQLRGGKHDHLIDQHGLKCAEVFATLEDVPEDMMIDFDDSEAMYPGPSFALLENFSATRARTSSSPRTTAGPHPLVSTHP